MTFNRDGKADIFWRSNAGYISAWLMDGANLTGKVELNPHQVTDTTWKPVGVGDFDRDSKTDILWQCDDGSLVVWFMDGINLISSVSLNHSQVAADTGRKPVGVP